MKNKVVARFEKVSYEQYEKDCIRCNENMILHKDKIKKMYDSIKLPTRATKGSAGYDFYIPFEMEVKANMPVEFPTGIRCAIAAGWALMLYPRSGHGFKYGSQLYNTVGVIDADYYEAENEGHIHCKLTAKKSYTIKKGVAYMQGILMPFGIAEGDEPAGKRTGGFGSTGV